METPVEASSLRKLVRLTGEIVALVTAVSGPFGYAVSSYIDPTTEFRFATLGVISLVGACLGPLAYLAFRTLPMRMLHRAVNATLGHAIGDALLTSVALRLRGLVRKQDTVIRLGGDEFAVIQRSAATPTEASDLAKRIITSLSGPYDLPGHQIEIGTSVGIAVAPMDSRDSAGLFQCADM